jgi:hypothetical protein
MRCFFSALDFDLNFSWTKFMRHKRRGRDLIKFNLYHIIIKINALKALAFSKLFFLPEQNASVRLFIDN